MEASQREKISEVSGVDFRLLPLMSHLSDLLDYIINTVHVTDMKASRVRADRVRSQRRSSPESRQDYENIRCVSPGGCFLFTLQLL